MSSVDKLLARLDTKKTANKGQKVDYKKLKAEKAKAMYKMKSGNNYVVLLVPPGQEDPFVEWSFHNNLQEVSYYSVVCDKANKHEHCTVCSLIEDLKEKDYEGNKHLWQPIDLKTENYAPVIDVSSEETKAEGPKWMKVTTTMLNPMITWLKNLEADEEPFYSEKEPMKLIITYDPDADPKAKYAIDKKNTKPFTEEQLETWKSQIKPLANYFTSKTDAEVKKLIDDYLERIEEVTGSEKETSTEGKAVSEDKMNVKSKTEIEEIAYEDVPKSSETKTPSKLASLKK